MRTQGRMCHCLKGCQVFKRCRPGNVLYLDGEGGRLINNMCFPSEVSPAYAPPGQASRLLRYPLCGITCLQAGVRHLTRGCSGCEAGLVLRLCPVQALASIFAT